MQAVTTIGLDIAKSVFQVHGVDARRQCGRSPPAEAPPGSAVLQEAAILPGWRRGLRHVTPLVA